MIIFICKFRFDHGSPYNYAYEHILFPSTTPLRVRGVKGPLSSVAQRRQRRSAAPPDVFQFFKAKNMFRVGEPKTMFWAVEPKTNVYMYMYIYKYKFIYYILVYLTVIALLV